MSNTHTLPFAYYFYYKIISDLNFSISEVNEISSDIFFLISHMRKSDDASIMGSLNKHKYFLDRKWHFRTPFVSCPKIYHLFSITENVADG